MSSQWNTRASESLLWLISHHAVDFTLPQVCWLTMCRVSNRCFQNVTNESCLSFEVSNDTSCLYCCTAIKQIGKENLVLYTEERCSLCQCLVSGTRVPLTQVEGRAALGLMLSTLTVGHKELTFHCFLSTDSTSVVKQL